MKYFIVLYAFVVAQNNVTVGNPIEVSSPAMCVAIGKAMILKHSEIIGFDCLEGKEKIYEYKAKYAR